MALTGLADQELLDRALGNLDLSSWIGWHEDGQIEVDCALCGSATRGRISLCLSAAPGAVVSVHRECMIQSLDEGPKERSEEIIARLESGGPLYVDDEDST